MTMKWTVIAAALLAACTTLSPQTEQRLEGARAAYRAAAADAQVQQYAQAELQRAAGALQDAERMAGAGEDAQLIEHNAYLAQQRARSAIETGQARGAQAGVSAAREARRQAEVREAQEEARRAEARAQAAESERRSLEREKTATAEFAAELKQLEAGGEVRAMQTPRGWVLALDDDTLFDAGVLLKEGAAPSLDNVADFLRKHPERHVAVEGFSNGERLSERRAQAVKFALVQRGIEPHRIDARGYGPSAPGRVELVIS
jgi:outer membrane protein OmpA-like peptidoglycan-associated protein